MVQGPNPWKLCMKRWPYMLKGTLKPWLNYTSWEGKIFLDFLEVSSVITRVLKWGGKDGYCHWTQSNNTDKSDTVIWWWRCLWVCVAACKNFELFMGLCPGPWNSQLCIHVCSQLSNRTLKMSSEGHVNREPESGRRLMMEAKIREIWRWNTESFAGGGRGQGPRI